MNYLKFLSKENIRPIIYHSQNSFTRLEQEVKRMAKGILKSEVHFHFIQSDKINAYAVKIPKIYFIGITDSLYQEYGFDVSHFINSTEMEVFFRNECNYLYSITMNEPSEESIRNGTFIACESNSKLDLISAILDMIGIFISFHEVAHISRGHLSKIPFGYKFCEFPEKGNNNYKNNIINYEYEADAEAACWLAQRVINIGKNNGAEIMKTNFVCSCMSMFILLILLPKYINENVPNTTHPHSKDRIMNVLYWFSTVIGQENIGNDIKLYFELIIKIIQVVNSVGHNLGFTLQSFDPNDIKNHIQET